VVTLPTELQLVTQCEIITITYIITLGIPTCFKKVAKAPAIAKLKQRMKNKIKSFALYENTDERARNLMFVLRTMRGYEQSVFMREKKRKCENVKTYFLSD